MITQDAFYKLMALIFINMVIYWLILAIWLQNALYAVYATLHQQPSEDSIDMIANLVIYLTHISTALLGLQCIGKYWIFQGFVQLKFSDRKPNKMIVSPPKGAATSVQQSVFTDTVPMESTPTRVM
jgi:hypothetical protein